MPPQKPRLLLADDNEDVLAETRDLLGTDFEVVGTASDGAALISAALELKPDVVVTDARMPIMNGIEASREILRRELCGVIVLLTVYGDPELVRTAFSAGIRAYVLKIHAGEELIGAVHEALRGRTFVSRDIAI
jgi:DNA-binding NarL/FixJ family response regulator